MSAAPSPVPTRRFWRRLKVAYSETHAMLAAVGYDMVYSPESLMRAVDHFREAQALAVSARELPPTRLAARVRKLAADNESVALEVLEVLSHLLNRVPRSRF